MAETQTCTNRSCGHARNAHSKDGCTDWVGTGANMTPCGCKNKYMDKDKFA
jgi:hypothetical protein